jgi:hypothetical protein
VDPFASNLEPFPWLNLQISMGERKVEEGRRGRPSRFGRGVTPGEMIEEREGRGVKGGFLLLWPHGLLPGDTGQTGEGHRSDQ